MCDPISIALGVVSVATTAAGVVSQAKAASAQEAAIRHQQAVVAEENRQKATGELFDQFRAARREQATIRVAAGEAGLSLTGGSIEGLLMDSAAQLEMSSNRTIANMESRHAANQAETESMLSQVQKPTALGAGLQIAGAGLGAWSNGMDAKLRRSQASQPSAGG